MIDRKFLAANLPWLISSGLCGASQDSFLIKDIIYAARDNLNLTSNGSHISPDAFIDEGAKVSNSIILSGARIFEGVVVRDSIVGADSVIGHCSEIARSIIGERCSLPRFNYVGSSIVGDETRFGGCVSCATRRYDAEAQIGEPIEKAGALIGAQVQVGFSSHFNPGVSIGRGALIGPFCDVRADVPDEAVLLNRQQTVMVATRGRGWRKMLRAAFKR